MKIEIKNRWSGEIIFSIETENMRLALEAAVKSKTNLDGATLDGANLKGANLDGATLKGANLDGATLYGATLDGANLKGANLDGATLYGANLYGANLDGANLKGATLDGANLYGANLKGANLDGATLDGANLDGATLDGANLDGDFTMPDGLKFSRYLKEVVPALLTAGGKTLKEILDSGCWECHSWENCPMHVAFGIKKAEDAPPIFLPRVKEFVQLFDAKLIPKPELA